VCQTTMSCCARLSPTHTRTNTNSLPLTHTYTYILRRSCGTWKHMSQSCCALPSQTTFLRSLLRVKSKWCVAPCCSMFQRVAACCSALQCFAELASSQVKTVCCSVLQRVAACCSELPRVAVRCNMLRSGAYFESSSISLFQRVAACCNAFSVLRSML